MIELERHIEILLLDNDCVIVPGLGGFLAHHASARYDGGDNMFLPPLRTLGFNPKLDMNDSLLAQSYVEAYDISYPEALSRIDAEVDEVKQSLERDGSFELEDIGVLLLNNDGNYEFEPCESGILTPGYYGLAEVEIEKLVTEDVVADVPLVPVHARPLAVRADNGKSVETEREGLKTSPLATTLVGSENQKKSDTGRTIEIKVSVLRNILAVACAVISFFLLTTPIDNGRGDGSQSISGIGNGLLYNLIPKDVTSGNGTADCKLVTRKTAVKPVVKKPVPVSPAVDVQTEKTNLGPVSVDEKEYCIVLACRITRTNADAFVSQLKEKKYDNVRVVGGDSSSLKVVYGSYPSESDALSALNRLRADNKLFKESWIYCVK